MKLDGLKLAVWGTFGAVVVAVVIIFPSDETPAAGPLLDEADAAELAQTLAEDQEEQGICYGWSVDVDERATDQGSSVLGPGRTVDESVGAPCSRSVELVASLDYTCDSCEGSDKAGATIVSNLSDPPTIGDLERLGYDVKELVGDNDDLALFNMVAALPLLTAERGEAAFVGYEASTRVPAADHPTGSPGADVWRDSWMALALAAALLIAGPFVFFYKRGQAAWRQLTDPHRTPKRRRTPAERAQAVAARAARRKTTRKE